MNYPTCCQSAQCGNFQCDGCRNRPQLVAFHKSRGSLDAYEAGQAKLRDDKANKRGAFAYLAQEVAS